jgi:hypothetical protein
MAFPSASAVAEIRNQKPLPGEQEVYRTQIDSRGTGHAHARIAFVPGLAGKGRVLLVAGSTGPATDAAAEFLLRPDGLEAVERKLGRRITTDIGRLEILLETVSVGGVIRDHRVLAVR